MPVRAPSAEQEAIQDPLLEPGDIGNLGKAGYAGLKAAMLGLPFLMAGLKNQLYKQSRIAVNPRDMDPKRFMTVKEDIHGTGTPYELQKYPVETDFHIQMPPSFGLPGQAFPDSMQGLNTGHALRRAADNWMDAERIQIVGKSLKKQMTEK